MQLTHAPLPLYFQLEQHLTDRIAKREYAPGSLLPTEEQLCEEYGVSRITVRRALDSLLNRRLIVRRRGVGTFVADTAQPQKSVHLTGSLTEALSYTKTQAYRVLNLGPAVDPPQRVRDALGVAEEVELTRLETVALLKKKPFAHSELYFPPEVGSILKRAHIIDGEAICFSIARLIKARIDHAEQTITPVLASPATARHLGLKAGTPVLEVQRSYYTTTGKGMETVIGRYHPERYIYAVDLLADAR